MDRSPYRTLPRPGPDLSLPGRSGLLALALACTTAPGAPAQTAPADDGDGGLPAARSSAVVRVDAPPLIDGVLDDPAWQEAERLTGFVQRTPFDGRPASEPTEVRVLSDGQALYVGVWLYDSDPSRIVDGERIRDARLDDSDAVLLILDTYLDRQNGFVFGTNPSGIEYDGQVANEGQGGGFFGGGQPGMSRQQSGSGGGFNLNWDGSWEVATSRDARGWYAEFRIPFSTLRYGPGIEQVWGFNVARRIRRHNEESFWSPVPRQFNLYRLSSAGTLSGIQPPGRLSATVTPYALASTQRDWLAGDDGFRERGEIGGDAKVQVTQGLTLDLTVNTDFAQVEVDEAQVNLSRFSLFFPEKRPFFLENAGFFQVGTGSAELFFSRRIGIAEGLLVPIQGGGRLSGRAAGLNVGLLHIRTEGRDDLQPQQAYSVARLARELPNRSRVGGIFVERNARGVDGDHNRTYALDGQVGIGGAVDVTSFLARTETPGLDGRDHAFDVQAGYTSRSLRGSVSYREVGEHFNPEVGFLPRLGYRYYQGFVMNYIRPESIPWLREMRPHVSYFTYRNLETGFEETGRLHVDSHFEMPDGTFFSPAFDWTREGLVDPFTIAPGIVVAPGTYEGWQAAWRFNTNESAALSFNGGIDWGSFLSGTRRGGSGTITYRRGASASTSLRVSYNDVRLAEGDFTTTLVGWRLGYFFTPRVYLQSLLQYSDQLDTWSANVRFGWLTTAGTGLFVVFNEARGIGDLNDLDTPLSRQLVVKFTRQFSVWGG